MADGLTLTEGDANTIFPDDNLEDGVISSSSDSENVESLNDLISDPDDVILPPSAMITETTTDIAVPTPAEPSPNTTDLSVALATTTPTEKKPIDDSRRLFQRLWTDEDEIELLQGFLDYTSSRGGVHHHDTTLFYDQVQGRLKLEFNKNQLVEKLRRLKKKYRNVAAKMNSSKDFAFKSSHDHDTYELSRKIWFDIHRVGGRGRGAAVGNGGGNTIAEFDDDEGIPNPNPSYNPVMVNLNTVSPACAGSGGFNTMSVNSSGGGGGGGLAKLSTRKRQKVEKVVKIEGGIINNNANAIDNNNLMAIDYNNVVSNENLKNVSVMSPLQGLVEETLKNCLSPVLKDVINNAVNNRTNATPNSIGGEGGIHGFKGVETSAMNTVPLHLPKVNVGEGMDEKWRKQQMMELEVFSKRLELVQEQIKLSLEELKSVEEVKSMES